MAYTKEYLKKLLIELRDEIHRLPTHSDWEKYRETLNLPHIYTLSRHFGSWNKALLSVFNEINVERTKEKYHMNCKQCNKEIIRTKKELSRVKNSFCTKSCAAIYNNSHHPKRIKKSSNKLCKLCDKKIKNTRNGFCSDCYYNMVLKQKRKDSILSFGEATLEETISTSSKYASKHRYQKVRSHAHRLFELMNWKKDKCEKCGYDKHVELCHIKSISDFSLNTKINDINSKENVKFLCPNCHWELDNLH